MRGSQLRLDVGEEGHIAGALDCLHNVALFPCGNAGAPLGEHLRVRVGEELQIRNVLVINKFLDFYFFALCLVGHISI